MALNMWRGAAAFLFLVVLLQFYVIVSKTPIPRMPGLYPSRPKNNNLPTSSQSSVDHAPKKGAAPNAPWAYDSQRDGRNIGLTSEQCDVAFPDLYFEIKRSAALWKEKKHTISPQDTSIAWRNDAAFRALIYDNQLRILQTKGTWQLHGYRRRALYTLAQLNRALLGADAAGEKVPNIEFAVVVDDMSLIPGEEGDTHSIWSFTRRLSDAAEDRLWIIPDFNFYASPPQTSSWLEQHRRASAHNGYLSDKIPKAIWRGARWTNEYIRGHLLDVGRGKDWADVEEIDWEVANNTLRMDDMCKYMFNVHTEGRSWSGRMKFLLQCDSILFVHDLDWGAEFYHLLKKDGPDQNYVHVNREFSDLENQVKYYLKNPNAAQRVVDNAMATFRDRYTTPAAESCYWRRLIKTYSEVSFTPEPFELVKRNVTGVEIQDKQVKGITYEEMLLWEGEDNYPPPEEGK